MQEDNFVRAWFYSIACLCPGSRTATISFLPSDLLSFPPNPDSSDRPLCPKGDKLANVLCMINYIMLSVFWNLKPFSISCNCRLQFYSIQTCLRLKKKGIMPALLLVNQTYTKWSHWGMGMWNESQAKALSKTALQNALMGEACKGPCWCLA